MKRVVVLAFAGLAGILFFMLVAGAANTDLFAGAYPYVLAVNGAVVVMLAALVFVQLHNLRHELRTQQFGARLKKRLLLRFALFALVPGALVYGMSLHFVVRSIDSWFDVRVERALDGGVALGQNALDYLVDQVVEHASSMAFELGNSSQATPVNLNRLRENAGVTSATLIAPTGNVLATVAADGNALLPDLPSQAAMREARLSQRNTLVDSDDNGGLLIRVVVPVTPREFVGDPSYLQLTQKVPENISEHVNAVQEAHREYQELVLGREGLSRIYTLTLTLTLLLALFTAIASAFIMARRFVEPLMILARGTRAVAAGDFTQLQGMPSRDEFGVVTASFNDMVGQLFDSRAQSEMHRAETEASRGYLESVLAHVSAGVLAFDAEGYLRAANRSATDILRDHLTDYEHYRLPDWPDHHELRDAIEDGYAQHTGDWHSQIDVDRADGSVQSLMVRGTRLPAASDGGTVVVFDDITHVIRAQRTAAWGEVAQRLAHEIKNPLTPIQLSAERLAAKLGNRLDPEGAEFLDRLTRTIVNQVEALKNLVNAFRDYAKLPAPHLEPVQLGELVRDVLHLYEGAPIRIHTQLPAALPKVYGDATQLRQIVHNLMQNAQDALVEHPGGGEVTLAARTTDDYVELMVHDNGPGFPAAVLARAFEPYFTTKSRGTGLGLAIVKKIVDEHGGDVQLLNRETGGAEIRIRLRIVHSEKHHHG